MGHAIEQIARSRGHEIVSIIDVNNPEEFESEAFRSADVAIEFTAPSVALGNYRKAFAAGVPVVSGTTGWLEHLSEIQEACRNGQTFFYASNFSLGVNIFFALNKYLAGIMNQFPAYDVKMEETHHIHKLDAPSGTATMLLDAAVSAKEADAESDTANDGADDAPYPVYGRSGMTGPRDPREIGVHALRGGTVAGVHTVSFFGPSEEVTLTHRAENREIFARGALAAVPKLVARPRGFYTFDDIMFG